MKVKSFNKAAIHEPSLDIAFSKSASSLTIEAVEVASTLINSLFPFIVLFSSILKVSLASLFKKYILPSTVASTILKFGTSTYISPLKVPPWILALGLLIVNFGAVIVNLSSTTLLSS